MILNYIKIAVRNVFKHKGFSFINIAGLATGIACSILILFFVRFELSYDTFHEKADRIYRIAVRASIGDTKINQTYSSAITFQKLLEEFPEIETGVKFFSLGRIPVTLHDKTFYESRVYAVDSVFFDVFTVPLKHGDKRTVLTEPNSMVVTEETALKYFGSTDVTGKVLILNNADNDGDVTYKITGVSESLPPNSHFHYDMLVSLTTFPRRINDRGWTNNNFVSYVVLKEGTSKEDLEEKFQDFTRKYMGGERFDQWVAQGNFWEYFLQPVTDIHLTSDLNGEFEANGNETYVYMFLVVSIIIMLIACINFMNLSTAKSSLRAREVGMRKVAGSTRRSLIGQFLTESVVLSFVSLILGLALVLILLPQYRNLVGRNIEINFFDNLIIIPSLIVLGLIVGIISGTYPAFVLSSFKPVKVLRGGLIRSKSGLWIRNVLILVQFSISIFLIAGTIVIYQQLTYFQDIKLGFDKEQVLVINNPGSLGTQGDIFKEVLRKQEGILNVSGSNTLPGRSFSNIGFRTMDTSLNITLNLCVCDYDFMKTMKLEMAEGRFFSREFRSDSTAVILNKNAAELIGWNNPLGQQITNGRTVFTVIGVIEDYHYESLHQKIRPQALFLSGGAYQRTENCISVRLSTADISSTIRAVENTWNRFAPGMPFEYSFLDEDYDNLYVNEKQTGRLFTIFSALAVFIACLGLFGLASFIAERKRKEIGIRKVLGATVPGIAGLLSMIFTRWVLLANLIAWPMTWFAMNRWLQGFAYRVNVGITVFLVSGILALVIALATVGYQAVKAALANPVNALKYE